MAYYLYRSVAGDFTIQKSDGGFALCINGRPLRVFRTEGDAVIAVYSHETYWQVWDAILRDFVEAPRGIDEWEKIPQNHL